MVYDLKTYIDEIKDLETKIKLESSLIMLSHIDNMNEHFNENNKTDDSELLLNLFGLLQGLFVGIDSLYNLVLSITKHKYYININQNPIIRDLKYIRNDVVGHPTNRKYGKGGVGYSKIDLDALTNESFCYTTYHFRRGVLKEKTKHINFLELIKSYSIEKDIIYDQLISYINKEYKDINFSNKVLLLRSNVNSNDISNIKDEFIKVYGNYPQHRFLWRLDLLEFVINWQEDNLVINEMIYYIKKVLLRKLKQISLDMENKSFKYYNISPPEVILAFEKEIKEKPYLEIYLDSITDNEHPYFESDLSFLIETIKDRNTVYLLNYMKNLKDNNKVFLIGSALKKYII